MTVLIVDDSVYMRAVIRTVLIKEGHKIIGEAKNGEQAIDMAIELEPELITLDNVLPDMLGIDILRSIQDEHLNSKVVMVSAVGNTEMREKAKSLGAHEYVVKPFEPGQLVKALNTMITRVGAYA
ncbi:response regulator [Reichenbachiella ulvae]|uniref:Response regulator n=1 Tax=Reichenbachiella ulvae TaxID=2980104 RepID=A0ABT3CN75_9BACT|nr:response regulator [Reichenbachiella ulvae]MCV9385196.1 response regulator [Reichenbachiella ulvae]